MPSKHMSMACNLQNIKQRKETTIILLTIKKEKYGTDYK